MTDLSDQLLLTHWYRQRNAEAFRVLATRYGQMVYATAMRVLRDPDAAEDVAQSSFVELAYTKFPPTRNAGAWLHRCAYRKAMDSIRSESRRRARDNQYARERSVESDEEWSDIFEHIDDVVAALPNKFRDPVVRYFFQAQTHAEIAESVGVSRQVISYRVSKGIETVRKEMKSRGIVVPASAALVSALHSQSALAIPVALTEKLGRLALVVKPSIVATMVSTTSGAAFKIAVGLCVLLAAGYVGLQQLEPQFPEIEPESPRESLVVAEDDVPPPVVALESLPYIGSEDLSEPQVDRTEPIVVLADVEVPETELPAVSGIVRFKNGLPFGDANILFMKIADSEEDPEPFVQHVSARADKAGVFHAEGLEAGAYSIQVNEPTVNGVYTYKELSRIELAADEHLEDLGLVFDADGVVEVSIEGSVIEVDGTPIFGANIYMEGIPVESQREQSKAAKTDELGRFRIDGVPPEITYLFVTHPDFAPGASSLSGYTTIVMPNKVRLRVEIYTADKPLPDTGVTVTSFVKTRFGHESHALTKQNGVAFFDEVVPGKTRVGIQLSSTRHHVEVVTVEPSAEQLLRIDVAAAEAEVDGVVFGSGGPVAEGLVFLLVDTGLGEERLHTKLELNGSFHFQDVPLGQAHLITLVEQGQRRAFVDYLPLESGKRTSINVEVSANCRITGTISNIPEEFDASITILRGEMDYQNAIATSSAYITSIRYVSGVERVATSGPFETTLVDPGTYTLLLSLCRENDYVVVADIESRVVQVIEGEDTVVHFDIAN